MNEIMAKKQNHKLDEEAIADICVSHLIDKSIKKTDELCAKYGITRKTIYNVVNNEKNQAIVKATIEKKNEEFVDKCSITIDKALARINEEIDRKDKDINLNHLATVTGVLYDKSRLEKGLSTTNNAVEINIRVDK